MIVRVPVYDGGLNETLGIRDPIGSTRYGVGWGGVW